MVLYSQVYQPYFKFMEMTYEKVIVILATKNQFVLNNVPFNCFEIQYIMIIEQCNNSWIDQGSCRN